MRSMTPTTILRAATHVLPGIQRYRNWGSVTAAIAQGHEPREVVLRNGVALTAPAGQNLLGLIQEIFFQRAYTFGDWAIGPNDVVVDIGANVGVFTVFAALHTRNRVIACEPFPQNVEFLRRNLEINRLSHARVVPVAVSDHVGTANLFLSEKTGGHLLFDHNIKGPLTRSIEVPTTTLPRLMDEQRLEQIDFLKLDCEGSEGMILTATPPAHLARIQRIVMEFHDNVSQPDHRGLQQLLERAGFTTTLRWDGASPFGYLYASRA